MLINIKTGLIEGIEFLESPNKDERPDPNDISGIVIHNISLPPGKFGGRWISDFFLNKLDSTAHPYFKEISDMKVSSHLLINRTGEIIQYVPFTQRAWHAGNSKWDEREQCNDFTIGIELEGCDDQAFEQIQYLKLAKIIIALCESYPKLNPERITGHEHIAPTRKTDPGPFFNWQHLRQLIEENNK